MMIMKLDYIFASLLLHFVLGEVKLKISFSLYFLRQMCWIKTHLYLNKKYRK